MGKMEHTAFFKGRRAAAEGRRYQEVLEELAADRGPKEAYFLLGYFEKQFSGHAPMDEEQPLELLQQALFEFFADRTNPPVPRPCAQSEALHELLSSAAPVEFDRYRFALFDFLDDLQRAVWYTGVTTALHGQAEGIEDEGLYQLEKIFQLPHIQEGQKKLSHSRMLLENVLEKKRNSEIAAYELYKTADDYCIFPSWFYNGYLCGIELGRRTIPGFQENKELTAKLHLRFFS